MCGICGFFQFNNKIPSVEELKLMNDQISHRGPDDEGFLIDKNVGLAQRRLSIIDLSPSGHQPMSSLDGNILIVFNGEIYNFLEIRNELKALGYSFESHCDTEVIIYAYAEWGEKCFARFNGMFAMAILDKLRNRLVLARDRLGKKPLYYYFKDGNFAFASELKAILKYPYFIKELDVTNMQRYFIFGNVPSPGSIYCNTRKLEAGHYMIVQDGAIKDHSYWDLVDYINNRKIKDYDMADAEEELESLLKSSISYRLISDVKLGAFLSGGIDSSIIVSMMAAVDKDKVKTFTIGFNENNYNEAAYSREIAKYLNTEHYEMYISPKDCFEAIGKMPVIYDEPLSDVSTIPTYLVSKLTKEHVTVALSGDGGDELFCGYNNYRSMNMVGGFQHIPYPLRRIGSGVLSTLVPDSKYKGFIPH